MAMTAERQDKSRNAAATRLRFTKTEAGRYYAKGAARTYLVVRDGTQWWKLTVFTKETVAGVEISGRRLGWTGCGTKTLAVLIAEEYEALGEDYKPNEHGHRERLTEAVGRAYQRDADREGEPVSGQRTKYQRMYQPIRIEQVKCTSRKPLDERGFCPDCGRHLSQGGRDHLPNRDGGLGVIEHYRDGSTYFVDPEGVGVREESR